MNLEGEGTGRSAVIRNCAVVIDCRHINQLARIDVGLADKKALVHVGLGDGDTIELQFTHGGQCRDLDRQKVVWCRDDAACARICRIAETEIGRVEGVVLIFVGAHTTVDPHRAIVDGCEVDQSLGIQAHVAIHIDGRHINHTLSGVHGVIKVAITHAAQGDLEACGVRARSGCESELRGARQT